MGGEAWARLLLTSSDPGATTSVPLFLPGAALWAVIASLLAGPVARWLGTRKVAAWFLLTSLGAVFAATLTPLAVTLAGMPPIRQSCDFTRITLASPALLLSVNDVSLNVLLFVPLGIAAGLVAGSRRGAVAVLGALALPIAIETVQLAIPRLGRGCESADVIDDMSGVLMGLAIGLVLHVAASWRIPPERDRDARAPGRVPVTTAAEPGTRSLRA